MSLWHLEEQGEEALLSQTAADLPIKVAQASRRQFGPIFEAGQQGLLTFILSMPRAPLPRRAGGDLAQP